MENAQLSLPTGEHETAARHMVTRIPKARPDHSVALVRENLHGQHYDCAETIFIHDYQGLLKGIVRINDLLSSPPECEIAAIMQDEHDAVRPDDDQEAVAALAMELGMVAVPVVDERGILIGAVPPEALMAILRHEHHEDLARIAGITRHNAEAVDALTAPLWERLRRRLPWLVIGLVASSLATLVCASFEHTLSANVAVSFFVPALVYIAGAIGTQAVSVAVRGLSLSDVPIGRLLRQEAETGLLIGAALAIIVFPPVFFMLGDHLLAAAVALAILGAGMVSAFVGLALPWLFQRLGYDPALGSGPICTIIQDIASLLIYFALVSWFLF
jgi:magnesium transporter